MSDATFSRNSEPYQMGLTTQAYALQQLLHLRNQMAGYVNPSLNIGAPGSGANAVFFTQQGQVVTLTKPNTIQFLDGGQVYWDPANNQTNFKRALNSKQFFCGVAIGDAPLSATSMSVQLNNWPAPLFYDLDLGRDEIVPPVIIGTAAYPTMGYFRHGGGHTMILAATNEAEKVDALGVDSFPATGARPIIEMSIDVQSVGSGASPKFNIGVASGTNATDITSAANYVLCNINGNSTAIKFQSKDGTSATISTTDSTKTLTAGTPFEIWLDMRNPASVGVYVEGVQVLTSTVFNVSAAASAWKLIAHLVKTATTDTFSTVVRWLRMRDAAQSIAAV
jgi:hypothetical protein